MIANAGSVWLAPICGRMDRSKGRRSLGRQFGWLWAAYAASAYGTGLGFGAFSFLAIVELDAGPAAVAALAAAGLAVGALVAVPLGPWVEFRRKRPVMIAMDLVRFAALISVPVAYALGTLNVAHLLVAATVVAAAKIAFNAAAGAYLKTIVPPQRLLDANGRFEATTWSATALGPPLGGAAIGLFGPVATVAVDALSHLLSALGIRAIRGREVQPRRPGGGSAAAGQAPGGPTGATPAGTALPGSAGSGAGRTVLRRAELLDGWRCILGHPQLRPLFLNAILVNGLIMAAEPSLAVLMLGELGFEPWQYGLAFSVPCLGGLIGSRLAPRIVARFGPQAVLRTAGTLRACWPLGLAFVGSGTGGLALVMVVELGLIASIGVFNPVLATSRLRHAPPDRVARTLIAWSISSSLTIAALTALWGLLATLTNTRAAIAAAGLLLLLTPLLLPRDREQAGPALRRRRAGRRGSAAR